MTPLFETLLAYGTTVAHVVVVLGFLLVDRRRPETTLAWLLTLAFLPGIGLVLYFVFGTPRHRRRARRLAARTGRLDALLEPHGWPVRARGVTAAMLEDPRTQSMLKLGRNVDASWASTGNACELLLDGAATYGAIAAAIGAATHHVHVEFYIIRPDDTGRALRDLLVDRARAGVAVRVLCDGVGSSGLPRGFWAPLVAAGGRAAMFHPVSLLSRLRRRDRIDFRNHRKIVVVDGVHGFAGGINVGREYLGLNPDVGHWRDTHVRISGPATLALQRTFAADWLVATGEAVDAAPYYPPAPPLVGHTALVQIVASGPAARWSAIHLLHDQAIALARERIWLTSPYFVPDDVLENALVGAALRGVDVRLLLPARSDAWLVRHASRSYFPDLLDAGVRIFEYGRGFLHAKTMVIDDWMATVGSANLDMRSFYLNFELNAFIYGRPFARELAAAYTRDIAAAREVTAAEIESIGYPRRLLESGARLLSPLL